MFINLPEILHESLNSARQQAAVAARHAEAVSERATKSNKSQDHLLAIKAAAMSTDAFSTVAVMASHVMSTLGPPNGGHGGDANRNGGPEDDDGEDCGNPDCPIHHGQPN